MLLCVDSVDHIKEMKLTADKTLGKVVREIREARKMKDTLAGLKKLRAIRSDAAENRGQLFPSSVGEHFNSKTDDLMELLTEQIVACEKEEAALKTEQAEAREKEENAKRQRQKEEEEQGLQEDLTSLFGQEVMYYNNSSMVPFEQFYQQACLNLHSLLAIRQTWDSFLVPEGTPGSSQVPDGWVEPEPPSSTTWATALKTS
ncbi:hypothetical protein C0Q70_20410 [Pomacea canaliculata]|uniref:Uncharacterized protein n=1 Tax=Pomacea canaliculata TaxID=400727 RepID=A0A2T7NFI3_POMCA|nr:hypothetical protein C0Q70_20410 [Pomacea canaliculata]